MEKSGAVESSYVSLFMVNFIISVYFILEFLKRFTKKS